MILQKTKWAFTLIELMVAIAIMSIIIIWAANIDYNKLNQKQELEIFTNNIKSDFERIRNNSLVWKWIWTDLVIPEKWVIKYSKSNSWTIITTSYNWATILNSENKLFKKNMSISAIRCLRLDWSEDYIIPISETGSLIIEWNNIKLKWDCFTSTSKILELTISNRIDTKIIEINSLNWLVEIK